MAAASASDAEEEEDDEYSDFYGGRHAFECIMWSSQGEIIGFDHHAPLGFNFGDKVPDDVLDDRAFIRDTFSGPFQFVVCATGRIQARDLDPNISLRNLFARARKAIKRARIEDGIWKKDGEMKLDSDGEPLFDYRSWNEENGFDREYKTTFFDMYWLARPFVEDVCIENDIVYVSSWGS